MAVYNHFSDGVVTTSMEGVYLPVEGNEHIYDVLVAVYRNILIRKAEKARKLELEQEQEQEQQAADVQQ